MHPGPQVAPSTDSDTIVALDKLVKESKDALQMQLAFIVHVMKPLYEAIKVLQKQSGGILDVMETFNRWRLIFSTCLRSTASSLKSSLESMTRGNWPAPMGKVMKRCSAANAAAHHKILSTAANVCTAEPMGSLPPSTCRQ